MKLSLTPLIIITLVSLISACSSDRYKDKHDSTPTRLPSEAELSDAIARAEPYSRGGNKDYQVFGKDYQVLNSAHGFEETGIASWYGKKFHGHLTSNGEIYDMYSMSAAHKNLPLPTYVKVTNTENKKSVIVRVNDRGPFHQSRIIDLSYSAAYKLDMLKTGTAQVKITAITDFDEKTGLVKLINDGKPNNNAQENTKLVNHEEISKSNPPSITATAASSKPPVKMGISTPYIQVFVTSKKELASSTALKLKNQYKQNTSFPEQAGLYRIQLGPIDDLATLNALLTSLKKNGYPNAYPRTSPQ